MDIINIVLILAGLAGVLLAGLKKDFASFHPGWLGLFAIGVVFLLQIVVKV